MSFDIASSTAGAAIGLSQARGQFDFGLKALDQAAQQQADAVTTLLGGSESGGNVTATRGQNLNITV